MGKQSARIYYQGKDHKDIYFQGNFHEKMYIGRNLAWQKIYDFPTYYGVYSSKIKNADGKCHKYLYRINRNGVYGKNLDNLYSYYSKDYQLGIVYGFIYCAIGILCPKKDFSHGYSIENCYITKNFKDFLKYETSENSYLYASDTDSFGTEYAYDIDEKSGKYQYYIYRISVGQDLTSYTQTKFDIGDAEENAYAVNLSPPNVNQSIYIFKSSNEGGGKIYELNLTSRRIQVVFNGSQFYYEDEGIYSGSMLQALIIQERSGRNFYFVSLGVFLEGGRFGYLKSIFPKVQGESFHNYKTLFLTNSQFIVLGFASLDSEIADYAYIFTNSDTSLIKREKVEPFSIKVYGENRKISLIFKEFYYGKDDFKKNIINLTILDVTSLCNSRDEDHISNIYIPNKEIGMAFEFYYGFNGTMIYDKQYANAWSLHGFMYIDNFDFVESENNYIYILEEYENGELIFSR